MKIKQLTFKKFTGRSGKIKQHKPKTTLFFSDLIQGRVYLGADKSLWDPKISSYLLGIRNGFCIFKLKETLAYLRRAIKIIAKINHSKKQIIFIGSPLFEKYSLIKLFISTNHFYTSNKFWINGILTNGKHFNTYMNNFFEVLKIKKKSDKLFFFRRFGGISALKKIPDLVVIYNHSESLEALKEASKMGICIVSFVNSDANPEQSDYPIPGNFTSKPAGKLYYKILQRALTR